MREISAPDIPLQRDSVIVEVCKTYIARCGWIYLPPTSRGPFPLDVMHAAIDELAAEGRVRIEPRGCGLEVIAVDPVMHAVPASVAAATPTWCEAQP